MNQNKRKRAALAIVAVMSMMAVGLAVLGARCVRLNARVRELERGEPAAAAPALPTNAVGQVEAVAPARLEPAADRPPQMEVLAVEYAGENELAIHLSERPDMDVVRRYVSVSPLAEGKLSFSLKTRFAHRLSRRCPTLIVRGEFAFRTDVTLRVAQGLPIDGTGSRLNAEGALKEEFTSVFRRKDRTPSVKFVADGRYLPPGGRRAIEIESVNVTNIYTEVRRVEPRNVVQLLAREEQEYRRCWRMDADDQETEELAGEPATNVFRRACLPNRREAMPLTVDARDGKSTNGIYLVSVLNHDRPRLEYAWNDGEINAMLYRLVCLSDLGLSVRRSGGDELGVWVTSLLTGKPVAGARVEVYSSANIKVMEGCSDATGWCRPARVDTGHPFAVVVVSPQGDDMTFLALRRSMEVDETHPNGGRDEYLGADEIRAFVWTDRGIYRHEEPVFVQAIVRNGRRTAPRPIPLALELNSPRGRTLLKTTALTDAAGTLRCETFSVPADQPSGFWTLVVRVPGKDGRVLGERKIKIEEFAPPQIRVSVAADPTAHPSNFAFTVSAEHLFGGPANGLACEGAVVFEDVPFAPQNWKGWQFGNEDRGLRPCYREVGDRLLDARGACRFDAPLWANAGLPRAAVRATGQGVVFEDGGRPATMRASAVLDYYPYYIGSTLPGWVKREPGRRPRLTLACVTPQGRRLDQTRNLVLKVERIDSVYSYREAEDGWQTWDCARVREPIAEGLAVTTLTNADTVVELPIEACGDYAVTVEDPETCTSFGRTFYLSDWGDDTVRAPLADPTAVTLTPDKAFYRAGDVPRLTVRAPFAGFALLSVLREKEVYTEVVNLTNATSEVLLRPVTADQAPNLDVYLSVVQSVADNAKHLAVRAKGQVTLGIRPAENEIPVAVEATLNDLKTVDIAISAPGASSAVVTVVDEAINLLTGEETPDPVGAFAAPCTACHPLYDLYHRILPVVDAGGLRVNGVKTGGGFGAEMLGRVSPVPTRRFKPLARWSGPVAITNGRGHVTIDLPEFVGEVRVTAVACSAQAAGAAAARLKVVPKLVVQPDAPRFVAPGDTFEVSLPIRNRSGAPAKFGFEITCNGEKVAVQSLVRLPTDGMTNVVARVTAPKDPGELAILFHVRGAGELHDQTIHLPVRPAVAWEETAGVERIADAEPQALRAVAQKRGWTSWRVFDSPVAELAKAVDWLADYPHGCLEQTTSRIFPLVAADGVLSCVAAGTMTNRTTVVAAGVRRVESMVRENDFVMWPDCTTAPWDREVSLYAAHFLVAAERAGTKLNPQTRSRVIRFLKTWATGTNTAVSVYACHTLALAGAPEKDRMLSLFDRAAQLTLLDRARLARAFVAIHDRPRAEALLANAASPSSVREATFAVLALLELDPDDARILPLVAYLNAARDRSRCCWGTTGENAHALLAMNAYYRSHPPKTGETYVAWRTRALPEVSAVKDEAHGIRIARRFLTPEGAEIATNVFRRGEMLIAELSLTSEDSRVLSDLVIEDLFAGAFEPIHGATATGACCAPATAVRDWVMRSDARDDRMLVFSKRFHLARGEQAVFRYPVRVVSAGEYVLPGPRVEAMYFPSLGGQCAPSVISVRK